MNSNQKFHNVQDNDNLFALPRDDIFKFAFDEDVAKVFNDMIQRSVPGYSAIIAMIGVLVQQFTKANSNLYDLGCSLGAASIVMRHRITQPGCKIIAVDKSKAMATHCRDNIRKDNGQIPVDVVCADISHINVMQASVVILNFTVQFIEPQQRTSLLSAIYQGMLPGSILVLSEKVKFDSPQEEDFQTQMHHMYKRLNGYSDLEISQKRSALENVLIPDSTEDIYSRLLTVGFERVYKWFQCFNFASFVAIK